MLGMVEADSESISNFWEFLRVPKFSGLSKK